ncbi:MAG: PEP-CTERM sorting domain-containing protein, partial [Chthoniobacterales bacterium]
MKTNSKLRGFAASIIGIGVLALTSASFAQAPAYGQGSLTVNDPTFTRPNGAAGTPYFYDVYQLSVTVTGAYTFELSSLNTAGSPSNALDTYLVVYANMFNPAAPSGQIGLSDDFTGTLTVLPGPFVGQGYTANSTGFTGAQPGSRVLNLNLTAGTPYFLVVTSFQAANSAPITTGTAGQRIGNYVFGVGGGPGNVVVVPEPSTFALLGIVGLGGAGIRAWRKRKA